MTDLPPAITWREASAGEAPLLVELMREFYASDYLSFEEGRARRALDELLADRELGRVWLIETAGQPVGYLVLAFGFSLEFGGRDAFVDELYVRPGFAGRGLGRATLAFVEREARASGVRTLLLEVRAGNDRARLVYERAGFVDRNNGLMMKELGPAGADR
jgi:ribosomal protein S18 acetylase RimI-like enzyme